MDQIIRAIGASLVLSGLLGSFILGYDLPLRRSGARPGFRAGVVVCAPFTLINGMPMAHPFDGWREE